MLHLKPAESIGKLEVSMYTQREILLKIFLSWAWLSFQFLRNCAFLPSFLLLAKCCAPSDTAVAALKDLAEQKYSWRQTNVIVLLGVCGFAVVVGRATKDLRNICEFVSSILGQVLIPVTLHYEAFKIWSVGENRNIIF